MKWRMEPKRKSAREERSRKRKEVSRRCSSEKELLPCEKMQHRAEAERQSKYREDPQVGASLKGNGPTREKTPPLKRKKTIIEVPSSPKGGMEAEESEGALPSQSWR